MNSSLSQGPGRLGGKVALVTGAGSGLGLAIATSFASEGGRIVVADVNQRAGDQAAESIREAGGEAVGIATDVSKEADCLRMVEAALDTFGRLDVLVNNAGISPPNDGSVLDTSIETWDRVLAVNLYGVALGCKYAIPRMLEQKSGSVINIASFVAFLGCSVPQDAYTASKGAVVSLTKSLAVQFAPSGVRTNAISPGTIATPMISDWLLADEEAKRVRLARNPSGRFGRPEEIAHAALYLASDESAWTNGAVLMIDGGITSFYF